MYTCVHPVTPQRGVEPGYPAHGVPHTYGVEVTPKGGSKKGSKTPHFGDPLWCRGTDLVSEGSDLDPIGSGSDHVVADGHNVLTHLYYII